LNNHQSLSFKKMKKLFCLYFICSIYIYIYIYLSIPDKLLSTINRIISAYENLGDNDKVI